MKIHVKHTDTFGGEAKMRYWTVLHNKPESANIAHTIFTGNRSESIKAFKEASDAGMFQLWRMHRNWKPGDRSHLEECHLVNEKHVYIADVEHTDTFGGEANYSWVTRKKVPFLKSDTDAMIVRKAKAALGLTGVRCSKSDFGDMIQLDPARICQRIFITFSHE